MILPTLRRVVPSLLLVSALASGLAAGGCGGGSAEARRKSGNPDKVSQKDATAQELLSEGRQAESDGKASIADEKYARAIRVKPDYIDAVEAYVSFLIAQHRPDDAVRISSAYHEAQPGDLRGYHVTADAQIAAGRYPEAYATLTELLEFNDADASAYEKRGRAQALDKKTDEAIADFRHAVELQPQTADYLVSLGSVLEQSGKVDEARLQYNNALQLDNNSARAHRLLGILLRKESMFRPDDIKEALSHHLKATSAEPNNPLNWFELGVTQNYGNDNLGAEESLKKALELDDRDGITWYAYGEVERLLKNYKEAIRAYTRALELPNPHPKATLKLGESLALDGQLGAAEGHFTELLRREPKNFQAWFNLGFVYGEQQKYKQGIEAYENYLKYADKSDGDIGKAKQKIKEFRAKLKGR